MENTGQGAGSATPTTETADGAAGTAQAQGQIAGGASGGAGDPTKSAAQEAMRRHKLKVDGQEIEVDDEELKRGYTHQKAANKKLQEGLKAKKQAEEFINMMKDKARLFEAIKRLGHDPRKLSEEFLASQLEEEMLDPSEKEKRELRNKLKTYEEREAKEKERQEKEQMETLKKKYADKYTAEFIEALKTAKLPPNKAMIAQMAAYIAKASKINFEMTPAEAAKLVAQDEDERIQFRLKDATPEEVYQILKDEGLSKVRAFDTSRLKDPNAGLKTPENQEPNTRPRQSGQRMTHAEWRRHKMGL